LAALQFGFGALLLFGLLSETLKYFSCPSASVLLQSARYLNVNSSFCARAVQIWPITMLQCIASAMCSSFHFFSLVNRSTVQPTLYLQKLAVVPQRKSLYI